MGETTLSDEIVLTDEYSKRTRFTGVRLVSDSTDAGDRRPQWVEMDIWRTEAGAYVVQRKTRYRVRHRHESCPRLGPNLLPRPATQDDNVQCSTCVPVVKGAPAGFGVQDRITVDVARTPVDLLRVLQNPNGSYSGFIRAALADISEKDQAVADLWLEEVVP